MTPKTKAKILLGLFAVSFTAGQAYSATACANVPSNTEQSVDHIGEQLIGGLLDAVLHLRQTRDNSRILELIEDIRSERIILNAPNAQSLLAMAIYLGDGCEDLIEFLLNGGYANVNGRSISRNTPLHCAVLNGNLNIVRILLRHNASTYAENGNGITPYAIAESLAPLSQAHAQICDDLRRYRITEQTL